MLLAIDTAGAVSVAVLRDDATVAATRHLYDPRAHVERLVPFITECLDEAGSEVAEITAVVVGQGPGPFTGLRVGLVTARTFGYARSVPVHGIASLDALAARVTVRRSLSAGTPVVVATDARRREVYWAAYEVDPSSGAGVRRVSEPAVSPADEVDVPPGAVLVGRGVQLYADVFGASAEVADGLSPDLLDPHAEDLGRIALGTLGAPGTWASSLLVDPAPLYLRRPDATPAAGRKSVLTQFKA